MGCPYKGDGNLCQIASQDCPEGKLTGFSYYECSTYKEYQMGKEVQPIFIPTSKPLGVLHEDESILKRIHNLEHALLNTKSNSDLFREQQRTNFRMTELEKQNIDFSNKVLDLKDNYHKQDSRRLNNVEEAVRKIENTMISDRAVAALYATANIDEGIMVFTSAIETNINTNENNIKQMTTLLNVVDLRSLNIEKKQYELVDTITALSLGFQLHQNSHNIDIIAAYEKVIKQLGDLKNFIIHYTNINPDIRVKILQEIDNLIADYGETQQEISKNKVESNINSEKEVAYEELEDSLYQKDKVESNTDGKKETKD